MAKRTVSQDSNNQQKDKPWKGMSIGRPPKYDYDGDEFYDEIFFLAFNDANDGEIAYSMGLTETAFNLMKNGKYDKWSEEENRRRSERLVKVLARARKKIIQAVRGKYLQTALGGQDVENVSTTKRHLVVDGRMTDDVEVQTTTTKTKTLPNMQALATFLYHHDPEWRKVQRGLDEEAQDIPTEVEKGIDIEKWIEQEVTSK